MHTPPKNTFEVFKSIVLHIFNYSSLSAAIRTRALHQSVAEQAFTSLPTPLPQRFRVHVVVIDDFPQTDGRPACHWSVDWRPRPNVLLLSQPFRFLPALDCRRVTKSYNNTRALRRHRSGMFYCRQLVIRVRMPWPIIGGTGKVVV